MIKSFHALLCWLLVASHCLAGITYTGAPGQTTYYVRIATSASASVAVALSEGSSGAVGFYTVSDAALVTAGLSSAGTYSFKVFSGSTPSTTANDALLATGMLPWSGSVEIGAPANVTQVSGDATAADNAEFYFDGTGYGPVVGRYTVSGVASNSELTISGGPATVNAWTGFCLLIRDTSVPGVVQSGSITGYDGAGTIFFNPDTPLAFTVVAGDIVEVLMPTFGNHDRTAASAIKTKTDSLTFTVANEVNANTRYWTGGLIPAQNITGVPEVDITHVTGSAASAVSGAIDVNVVKLIGNEIQLTPP